MPSGTPRRSATSVWVSSSRCWRRTTSRSSGGSVSMRGPDLAGLVAALDALRELDDGRVGRRQLVERRRRSARLAAVDVDGRAPGDRGQPRAQLAHRVEAAGRLPRLDERALGRLLGEVAGPERAQGDGEHQTAVLAVHGPHGVGVPVAEPEQLVGRDHGRTVLRRSRRSRRLLPLGGSAQVRTGRRRRRRGAAGAGGGSRRRPGGGRTRRRRRSCRAR